jgi:hypothetical protein
MENAFALPFQSGILSTLEPLRLGGCERAAVVSFGVFEIHIADPALDHTNRAGLRLLKVVAGLMDNTQSYVIREVGGFEIGGLFHTRAAKRMSK